MVAIAWQFIFLAQVTLRVAGSVACYDGQGSFAQTNWPHCQKVHDSLLFYFGVSADGDYLKLGLYAKSQQGWSSVSLAGNGGMKGSQSIVVRQDSGRWVAEERYATGYATPALQATQDATLIFVDDSNGDTAWGVLLPMTSCKAGERYPIENISRWILWAMGTSHGFAYHGNRRGQFHANLISGPSNPPDFSGMSTAQLRMPNVDVVMGQGGADPTNPYVCTIFDIGQVLPQGLSVNSKHHAVKLSPILNTTNEKYLHHMLLYGCSQGGQFSHGNVVQECESMPQGCYDLKYAWAVGSEDIVFPADVGMPFGGAVRWLALQFHYYNPSLDAGVKDNSGVQLTLANTVRAQDAAIMSINGGTSPSHRPSLPPGNANFVLSTMVVPAAATSAMPHDINIHAAIYHGHLVGKSFKMEITNNGNYVGMVRHEKRYDFNHQSLEEPSVKQLRRGDELTFSCTYDTSSRTQPTAFGDQTQTEMCWGALMYYPAVPSLSECSFCGATGGSRCTYCTNMQSENFFTAPPVIPPPCQIKGDLSSTNAASIINSLRTAHSYTTQTTTTTTARLGTAGGAVRCSIMNLVLITALFCGMASM